MDERRKRREAVGGVLGVSESNLEPQTAAAEPLAEEDDEGGSLPFTGLALGALLLMAAVSVAVGTALRRASHGKLTSGQLSRELRGARYGARLRFRIP